MSALGGKIRVTEKHGIRRFLYPLSADIGFPDGVDLREYKLVAKSLPSVPFYVDKIDIPGNYWSLHFAVSLAPNEVLDLELVPGEPDRVSDPIAFAPLSEAGGIKTTQQRLSVEIDENAILRSVIYDGVQHLRAPLRVSRNNAPAFTDVRTRMTSGDELGAGASIITENLAEILSTGVSACKSWVSVGYAPRTTRAGEQIAIQLPFAATTDNLLCDFGTGGGIYTKLDRSAAGSVVWDYGFPNWSLRNNGRIDYAGKAVPDEFTSQAWFHVVDAGKSIAVAITSIPHNTELLTAKIDADGLITVECTIHEDSDKHSKFAVCYHFLNDVPAIAAATCPQSILLTPSVEVVD